MQTAQEVADDYKCPVILGDQNISLTNGRFQEELFASFTDIFNPLKWQSLGSDIFTAGKQTLFLPSSENFDFLSAKDFLDPSLLLAAPLSFLRYPLAIALKSPFFFITVTLTLLFAENNNYFGESVGDNNSIEIFKSLVASILELLLLGRPFLVALLHERNVVLADKIRESCRAIKKQGIPNRVCVVILGMAHSNGVANILTNEQ